MNHSNPATRRTELQQIRMWPGGILHISQTLADCEMRTGLCATGGVFTDGQIEEIIRIEQWENANR